DRAEGVLNDGIGQELLCAFEALQSAYEQQHKAWQESYANLASMYESTKQRGRDQQGSSRAIDEAGERLNAASGRQSKQLEGLTGLVSKLQRKEHRLLKALDRGWERGDRSRGFER
ncbi:MbeD/MobD family mobilization/exclusion protein, partial [Klebsiella pneumoniae]|uniref:MbeD/MobD family mobilization/exclusion protein n=1 Tax=Klebsiella pneumoniae TaxID=573 RepID=UPI0010343B05